MKSYKLVGILFLLAPAVDSFVAQHISTKRHTTQLELAARHTTVGKPLFLHVEGLHPHRDSIVCLEDPIPIPDVTETKQIDPDKKLHSFTYHIAPLVLAVYLVGHFLSTYHNGNNIDVDPMFGGYVLIGAGLYMMKWSIDNAMLSPI